MYLLQLEVALPVLDEGNFKQRQYVPACVAKITPQKISPGKVCLTKLGLQEGLYLRRNAPSYLGQTSHITTKMVSYRNTFLNVIIKLTCSFNQVGMPLWLASLSEVTSATGPLGLVAR